MIRHHLAALLVILTALGLGGCAGTAGHKPPPPPDVTQLDADGFARSIVPGSGLALVLFYNDTYPQSRDMLGKLDSLAAQYKGKALYGAYFWEIGGDPAPYRLEMLPTLVMYRNGVEVDRMRGVPAERGYQENLRADLELWFIKTGLGLARDEYHGQFTYRFNNSSRLDASN